jgi:hypothetical protein
MPWRQFRVRSLVGRDSSTVFSGKGFSLSTMDASTLALNSMLSEDGTKLPYRLPRLIDNLWKHTIVE